MAQRYNLLVIDDEQDILDEIKTYFEKRNEFSVKTALSGEEGLELLRHEAFDVALIDLVMPQMSGLDVIQKINEEFIPVSIAIITGHGGEKEAVAALNMGGIVHAWFTKGDFDMEYLYRRVKELAELIPENKLNEFFSLFDTAD